MISALRMLSFASWRGLCNRGEVGACICVARQPSLRRSLSCITKLEQEWPIQIKRARLTQQRVFRLSCDVMETKLLELAWEMSH
jgi:hypothetical protein